LLTTKLRGSPCRPGGSWCGWRLSLEPFFGTVEGT
jgi:hypothetical protein